MATAGLADIQSNSWGHIGKNPPGATGWRSLTDSTDKQTAGEDQIVVLAQALGIVFAPSMHKCHRA